MRTTKLLIAAGGLLAGGLVPYAAHAAPIDKICRIVQDRLVCTTDYLDPGGTPAQGGNDGSARPVATGSPTAVWTSNVLQLPLNTPEGAASGPIQCTTDGGAPGVYYVQTLRSIATGELLQSTIGCVGQGADPATTPTAPPPPPPPPTVEELVAATPIPKPEINANPSRRGLTGLESWFWAADPGTVTASVSLRGWTVSGRLSIGSWVWETGDGGHYETDGPGGPENPAVLHMYETKGMWTLSVEVSWSGSYTVSGYGASFTVDGLSVSGSDTMDYPVIEVRGVIDDDTA